MVGTYWWLVGAKVFFSGPWFPIFQIFMIVRDHRQHRDWRSSLLAVVWPLLCVSMIYVLQGSMDPPLFGVPLASSFPDGVVEEYVGVHARRFSLLYYERCRAHHFGPAWFCGPLALSAALAHILCAPVHVALSEDAGVCSWQIIGCLWRQPRRKPLTRKKRIKAMIRADTARHYPAFS